MPIEQPITVRVEPLGVHVRAAVDGRPELHAIGGTVGVALARLGRRVEGEPFRAAPAPHGAPGITENSGGFPGISGETGPSTGAPPPAPVDVGPSPAFTCPSYSIVRSARTCVERFRLVNEPQPVDPGACAAWARVRVESGRCIGCPIGARGAGGEIR